MVFSKFSGTNVEALFDERNFERPFAENEPGT